MRAAARWAQQLPPREAALLHAPWIMGLSPGPATTLNGQWLMSCWMVGSENLRPMSRLASNTVLRQARAHRRRPEQCCVTSWAGGAGRGAAHLIGFIATWFLAASPISRSVSVKAT